MKKIALLVLLVLGWCKPIIAANAVVQQGPGPDDSMNIAYQLGADRFEAYMPMLVGKRVALVVNQSSYMAEGHLLDFLVKRGIDVRVLFALEHGIRGTEGAGVHVADGVDQRTGIPIKSLYGKQKKPADEDLQNLDVIVYDIQDVGVRFFTYISSLHYIMEASADSGIELIVLDRPNPNGDIIDGPVLDLKFRSFVGMHPIPVLYGMTVGEIARMINGENWLADGRRCPLSVVPMAGYRRTSFTKLPKKPSPNLPTHQAVRLYATLALFEATDVSIGRGTFFPFQVTGGPDTNFGGFQFTPKPIKGMSMSPKHLGQSLFGQDLRAVEPFVGINIDYFMAWRQKYNAAGRAFLTRPGWLDKLMGTDAFRLQLEAGKSSSEIRASWQPGLKAFKARRQKYLLYPEDQLHKGSSATSNRKG